MVVLLCEGLPLFRLFLAPACQTRLKPDAASPYLLLHSGVAGQRH